MNFTITLKILFIFSHDRTIHFVTTFKGVLWFIFWQPFSHGSSGYLDRAVDFSQQTTAFLIYRGHKVADENYDFIPKPRRFERSKSVDKKSKPLNSSEIRGSAK